MKISNIYPKAVDAKKAELEQRRLNHLANVELLRQELVPLGVARVKKWMVANGYLLADYENPSEVLSEHKAEELIQNLEQVKKGIGEI